MEPEKNTSDSTPTQAPADALSMKPDELETEPKPENNEEKPRKKDKKGPKPPSKFKLFLKRVNIYFLMFVILLVIAATIAVVTYLLSQKEPPTPVFEKTELTQEALQELANKDASIGNANQQVTIKGNAVIDGHTLMRSGADVAGELQASGMITAPNLTISGTSNLSTVQIDTLQIAGNNSVQGDVSVAGNLSVTGSSTFRGQITASSITATNLTLGGNAIFNVPQHIRFTGPSPGRTTNPGVIGTGGSASISGSDNAGTVIINTGSNPNTGCLVTVSFNVPFSSTPYVNITPVEAGAGRLNYYTKRTTTNFQICSANQPSANARFAFDYFITG